MAQACSYGRKWVKAAIIIHIWTVIAAAAPKGRNSDFIHLYDEMQQKATKKELKTALPTVKQPVRGAYEGIVEIIVASCDY